MDIEAVKMAAKKLAESKKNVALTGAGISVESGIPDFRSPGGLWERFDPMEYAHIAAFRRNPEKVWDMLIELDKLVRTAKPNKGHLALAQMEKAGKLSSIITQNIDNLHQRAGSKKVIEFHGNSERLVCLTCGGVYSREQIEETGAFPPECQGCMSILKPDVIFFGEAIPMEASMMSRDEARTCGVMIVVGTSAMVAPASAIPLLAKEYGSYIIEFNIEETGLTHNVTDLFVEGHAGETLPAVVDELLQLI